MVNISGLIHYHVILRVYPNMSHHTSSRPRKSASSNDKTKKMPSVLKCSILNSIRGCPLFSRLVSSTLKCDKVLTTLFMGLNQELLQGLAIIMGSLEVPLVGLEDILLVGTLVGDTITRIVEVKEEEVAVMAVGHILPKGGVHRMVQVVCLVGPVVVLVVGVVVAMELELQIILQVLLMVDQQQGVVQT